MADPSAFTVEIVYFGGEKLSEAAGIMAHGIAVLAESMRADPGPIVARLGTESDCLAALSDLRQATQNALRAVAAYSTAQVRNGQT